MNDLDISEIPLVPMPTIIASAILIHIERPSADDRFAAGATVSGSGWVLAESDVREIGLYLEDRFVCFAAYGETRVGVAAQFPHFAQAESSGFSFNFNLDMDVSQGSTIWLFIQVSTSDGCIKRKGVPLTIVSPDTSDKLTLRNLALAGVVPVKILVEKAVIDGSGLLRVSGWVVTIAPLVGLELFLGDEALGLPEVGLPRPDVAAIHSEFPESAASGFRLVQDISNLKAEHPVLRVRASALGGLKRQAIVPVTFPHERKKLTLDDTPISLCVDSFAIRSDGSVSVAGWAVASAGVDAVTVEMDGQVLGAAEFGADRPDVGNRFPRIQAARRSGFSFNHDLETTVQGEHLLAVHVEDSIGTRRSIQIPLLVEEAGKPTDIGDHLTLDEEIRFDIDAPLVDGERAREPIRSALTISGWALSLGGMERIDIFLDDQSLGSAYYGMRREDIAAAFPHIEGSLLSGYALTVPHRLLGEGEGERSLRIVFKSKGGKIAERTFTVDVTESEETISSTLLRGRISDVERDFLRAKRETEPTSFFSIVVRSTGSDIDALSHLQKTIMSLRAQAMHEWQAMIVPSAGQSRSDLYACLAAAAGQSAHQFRIADETELTLATLRGAPGDETIIMVLHAGDVLGPDAFLKMASDMASESDIDFCYSDDRRVDSTSCLVTAFFKPDWSPDLIMATNYIGRAWGVSYRLAEATGLSFNDLACAPTFDLVLRLTERAQRIHHIPHVLLDTGAASADDQSLDPHALAEALTRRAESATIVPGRADHTWRVKRPLTTTGKVSIIMPTCAARGLIRICVDSIRTLTSYKNYEIIVIDNIPDSLPEERAWVEQHCDKVLRIPDQFNWSRFNNIGAQAADGEFLLFLNDDIQVLEGDWLETMLAEAERPEIGVVGPQLLYPDGKVQHAGIFLTSAHGRHAFRFSQSDDPGYFGLALTQRNMIAVTGACMLSRRDAYDRVGGFDEAHSVVNNDLDYCLRMWRAGLRVLYTPFATLTHHELASRSAIKDIFDEERFAYENKLPVVLTMRK